MTKTISAEKTALSHTFEGVERLLVVRSKPGEAEAKAGSMLNYIVAASAKALEQKRKDRLAVVCVDDAECVQCPTLRVWPHLTALRREMGSHEVLALHPAVLF